MKYFRILRWSVTLIVMAFPAAAIAQDEPLTRSATSLAFKSKRPAPARSQRNSTRPRTPARYAYTRTERRPGKLVATPTKATAKPTAGHTVEIGLTIWRLRPPDPTESGIFFPVLQADDTVQRWLSERVGVKTPLKMGEPIRFAIESSIEGYLYVFNRETASDGKIGPAYLIFPESDDDDNVVGPGLLFDIPDQRDEYPYYRLKPREKSVPKYNGELLTIIISPKPLTGFQLGEDNIVKNEPLLNALEESSESDVFDRVDLDEKSLTKVEAESSCGATTRGLEREKKSGKGCPRAKRLGPDDPEPQVLFRVRSPQGRPIVAYVRLAAQS